MLYSLHAIRRPFLYFRPLHALTARPLHQPQLSTTPVASTENVALVTTRRDAARVVTQLMSLPDETFVAWDTETTGVNPAKQTPVGNGSVLCATAFAGDHIDFGGGNRLFVDVHWGETGLLDVFKPYFESENVKKVWHNYAFDRHVLGNHGINVGGFGGDTMHMARLHNSSLPRFSLEELCLVYLGGDRKTAMKERFGKPEVLKNGNEGKSIVIPDTVQLHTDERWRPDWIDYAASDAELTFRLCNTLKTKLEAMKTQGNNILPEVKERYDNMFQLYQSLLLPFGVTLTDMERKGFKVDIDFLKAAEIEAGKDQEKLEDKFREWAQTRSPDAKYMNIRSDVQKQQLFFAPCKNTKDSKLELPKTKSFCIELTSPLKEQYLEELKNSEDEEDRQRYEQFTTEDGKKAKKVKVDIALEGLGKKTRQKTMNGWPSVSASALRTLAGEPNGNPPMFGDPDDPEMCFAIDDLVTATSISTLSSTFIVPLQHWPGADGRIHASLNLNTETGRLSSRRPNLQNQPALEKDRYKVRKAFVAEHGKQLIVADYGQLELRLLAHITNCKSMIDAFEAGGDFHSRTALTMFDEISRAVERGECILERDESHSDGECPPLLKDMFSIERRKAKTLNFSIAYGKTVQGLAKDWNVSEEEAKATLNLWYKERQEVRSWQTSCKKFLRENEYVETILGRRRYLPDINSDTFHRRSHAQRAAINAPLQGSAADLVMAAMVKLHNNRVLNALDWKIVLQVHDEIILEGPVESADVALPIVIEEMKNPIDIPLRVDLTVDAKCARTWYDAK